MGGSRPSAPVTYMPKPATPSLFISEVPEEDFARATDLVSRTEQMRQDLMQKRYKEVGTSEELGERQAGVRAQEAASYAASLPQGDRYLENITGVVDQYKPAIEQAATRLTQAQQDYGRAIEETKKSRQAPPAPAPSPAPAPAPAPKTYSKSLGDFNIKNWNSRNDAQSIVNWYNKEAGAKESVGSFQKATGVKNFNSKNDAQAFLNYSLSKLNKKA